MIFFSQVGQFKIGNKKKAIQLNGKSKKAAILDDTANP